MLYILNLTVFTMIINQYYLL